MFDTLSDNLGSIFDRLRGRGALSEKDVDAALGEIRAALLEADVALPVARAFLDKVRPLAVGSEVLKSVTPGQQVVKIVNDALIDMLGQAEPLSFEAVPPVVFMMVGLQRKPRLKPCRLLTGKARSISPSGPCKPVSWAALMW